MAHRRKAGPGDLTVLGSLRIGGSGAESVQRDLEGGAKASDIHSNGTKWALTPYRNQGQ